MARYKRAGIRPAVVAAAVFLAAAAVVAGWKIRQKKLISDTLSTDTFYPGTVVAGVDLGGKTMSGAKAAVEAALEPEENKIRLKLVYGQKSWGLKEKDLGYRYNTDEVLKQAYAYARSGSPEERYRLVRQLRSAPKKYDLKKTLDGKALSASLGKIADEVDVEPLGPKVVSFNRQSLSFSFGNSTPGISVDRAKLLGDAKAALSSGAAAVALPAAPAEASESLSELKAHMKKLGTYSTVSKNSADGTFNMARALAAADGTRIDPGKTFSFFGTVGKCGKAEGYRPAGAILNGKSVQEYGGGICQASTTIYGAALRSGMKITERYNHSIPSSYCPIGQDATVSYPSLDFKFTNPTSYPVWLVTSTKGRTMTAAFYGYQPDDYDSVAVTSRVTATVPAPSQAQYTADSSLAKGEVRLLARARTGYRAAAQRIFKKNGKTVRTEALPSSYYRPQAAYYARGSGSDPGDAKKGKTSSSGSSQPSSTPRANDDVTENGEEAA